MGELRNAAEATIQDIRAGLPVETMAELMDADTRVDGDETASVGAVFKLEPEQRDDYAGREDLYVANSALADLWPSTLHPAFRSSRFLRHGELLCYLKTDGRDGFGGELWEDRGELEDDLHEALCQAGAGAVWGGGTGLIYSYVDLALTDVTKGLDVLRKRLQAGKVHERTWVLFLDPELAEEWVGAYDTTPPPPAHDEA